MSIGPSVGSTRRNGSRNQSVVMYDQRHHFEYGPPPTHDEITRAMMAMRRKLNVQLTMIAAIGIPCPRTEFVTRKIWEMMNSNTDNRTSPPTTTSASVHHGADDGRPPARTTRQ